MLHLPPVARMEQVHVGLLKQVAAEIFTQSALNHLRFPAPETGVPAVCPHLSAAVPSIPNVAANLLLPNGSPLGTK